METVREIGAKVLCTIWNFILDFIELIICSFKIVTKYHDHKEKKSDTEVVLFSSSITIASSLLMLFLFTKSFLCSGVIYAVASIEKHLAILWASDHDWSHILSGGRFEFFEAVKDNLISNDKFAQFLSSLAGHGFFLKALQLAILAFCTISFIILISILLKSIYTLIIEIIKLIK